MFLYEREQGDKIMISNKVCSSAWIKAKFKSFINKFMKKKAFTWDLDYNYRLSFTVNTTKTMKNGLKCAVNYLPDDISIKNKHDIVITSWEGKKLSYLWCEDANTWNRYKGELIILDDWSNNYALSIPVPKDVGLTKYYVYYKVNNK